MKISTLIKREPFEHIFEKTLVAFLNDFNNCPHSVHWETKRYFNTVKDSSQLWYCNSLINSVFVKNVNPDVFNSINGEYAYNPLRPWRSAFQKMYLAISQFNRTAAFMSKYVIHVSPAIEGANKKLILGGNTKIRLIDIDNNNVYVILKEGFDKKYLDKEIYVRTNFSYLPIPKLKTHGNNSLWYCEEYISGISPNRMDINTGKNVLIKVIQNIHRMLNETKQNHPLSHYMLSLKEKINEGLDQISYIDPVVKRDIKYITSKLTEYLEIHSDQLITIAYCHGDFHQGNILSNGEYFWILDWENSGQKQIGYDLFILLLESRIESGFSHRFLKLLNNEFNDDQMELINNWPEIKWDDKIMRIIYLIIFLLEDINFHVDENNNDIFYEDPNVLSARTIELKKIVTNLLVN